jgi:hypothetical protein
LHIDRSVLFTRENITIWSVLGSLTSMEEITEHNLLVTLNLAWHHLLCLNDAISGTLVKNNFRVARMKGSLTLGRDGVFSVRNDAFV